MTLLESAPVESTVTDDHNQQLLYLAGQLIGEPTGFSEIWIDNTNEAFVLLKSYFRHLRQNYYPDITDFPMDFEARPEVLHLFSDAAEQGIQAIAEQTALSN